MKILISANVVWWNASAYYAVTAAQALAQRGHDMTVLAHESTPAFREAQERQLKTMGLINLLDKSPLSFLKIQRAVGDLLQREQFDIINPHRPEDHFHLALANQRQKRRAKLARTVSDVRIPSGNAINRRLHANWTNGLIYCAECAQRRYHQGLLLSDKPEQIIYSALDIDEFTRGDWQSGNSFLDLSFPRIGMAARLSPNKGHQTLIEAAARVIKESPGASFIIVGKEEEIKIADLRDYARQLGVERAFTFTGFLDDPRPAMAACDIGVIASTESEVISRAAQEFFAFGVPVAASRVNVLPEMVEEGVNGLVFSPGNATELAAALLQLIKDSELRKRCGEGALARVKKRHDLGVLGEQTESLFAAIRNN